MQRIVDEHAHHLPAEQVLEILGVDPRKGLDRFEVEARRQRCGPNVLSERKGRSPLVRLLLQFHNPLVYILLAATLTTALLKEYVDAAVIFAVVLVNAVLGYVQEAKALTAIRALARSLTSTSTVLRAGAKERLSAEDLVPGDVVLLQSGDRVPADLRLVQTRDLQVDESALTGEAVPAQKGAEPLPRATPLADRTNMAFSSTLVTYGTATGVAVATGDRTEIGRVSELIASAEVLETPLTRKIHHFSRVLLVVILGLAALAFVVGLAYGEKPIEMFMASVALAVGAIPEGLPAAVTIIMAIGVARMAQRRAIIRHLPAVETLGSTTIICSDKTGTLTKNQMTVQRAVAAGRVYTVSGAGYGPDGEILQDGQSVAPAAHPVLLETLRCGLLCNDAELTEEAGGLWKVHGDPTEGALISTARKAGLAPEESRREMPRLDAIPFESQHQYMATLHRAPDGAGRAYVKGSLERILTKCRAALGNDGEVPLDRDGLQRDAEAMAALGLRVLAFGRKDFPAAQNGLRHEEVAEGLVFLGLQGMMDPPRPEAAQAVTACQRAGIRVTMITGDHAVTAASIARQIGIEGALDAQGVPRVLTSENLEQLSDRELVERVEEVAVFARVTPEHKLRLVKALQTRGHVVAMTGDGVNDAPALRQANIGVAMALGGTEVAREAADMVLTDDNFATIEAAVEEGRGVFDNLRKFIVWTLPTNGGEGLVLLVAILFGMALPILPVQILWINMTTAVLLGMTLAFEPKEAGIMARPPSDPAARILDRMMIERIALVSALLCVAVMAAYEWQLALGATAAQARTTAVAVIVFGELFYLFNCRSLSCSFVSLGLFSNRWVWGGAAAMAAAQVLFTYVPAMNRLFGSEPLPPSAWVMVLGFGLAVSFVVGLQKAMRRSPSALTAPGPRR
jgi:cation-transporting P-type ATPase F